MLRLIRRRFDENTADQSALMLERIEQPAVLEGLFENLLDCPDESAWLARLQAKVEEGETH
ncbi:MAG: hypothetical protein WBQ37_08465 [Candidatus Competibacter sp.]